MPGQRMLKRDLTPWMPSLNLLLLCLCPPCITHLQIAALQHSLPLAVSHLSLAIMEGSDFIKQEFIKPEPSDAPAGIDEEDLYEDAGDLDFYDKNAPSNCFETLYLARVPKTMWEAWAKLTEKLGDDDEIQIGTLRTWNEPVPDASVEGGTRDETKLRMLLSANCPEHQGLPREYDLEVLDRNVNNHFIFSEEDLPGYKARNKARAEATKAGIPSSLLRAKQPEGEKRTYDRRSRYQPYYRKAIPSKQPDLSRVGRRS